jgi:hypothetical protein
VWGEVLFFSRPVSQVKVDRPWSDRRVAAGSRTQSLVKAEEDDGGSRGLVFPPYVCGLADSSECRVQHHGVPG